MNKQQSTRFNESITRSWNTCEDCPYREFVSDDYSPDHVECTKTERYISMYLSSGDVDYTNKDGILDTCPYANTGCDAAFSSGKEQENDGTEQPPTKESIIKILDLCRKYEIGFQSNDANSACLILKHWNDKK